MDEKITLDRDAFRTLASGTRVDIIKSLDKRRKMLTELSKQFGMSPSTIKEHMQTLAKAGLVVQIDDGHKWKYYELTPKAKEILHPTGTRIFLVLGLSIIALIATTWDLAGIYFQQAVPALMRDSGPKMLGEGADAMVSQAPEALPMAAPAAAPLLPVVHILGIAVFTAILGVSIGYILARRSSPSVI